MLARSSGLPLNSIFPVNGLVWIFQLCLYEHFLKLKKCLSRKSSDYILGIIDIKIPHHKKHYLFYFQSSNCFTSSFFCMHFCVNKDGGRIIVFQLITKPVKNKDQYFQPFSRPRNAGNEVATLHPGQNATLKNLY